MEAQAASSPLYDPFPGGAAGPARSGMANYSWRETWGRWGGRRAKPATLRRSATELEIHSALITAFSSVRTLSPEHPRVLISHQPVTLDAPQSPLLSLAQMLTCALGRPTTSVLPRRSRQTTGQTIALHSGSSVLSFPQKHRGERGNGNLPLHARPLRVGKQRSTFPASLCRIVAGISSSYHRSRLQYHILSIRIVV